jgi:glycosyltransferase involved in cell wall biosynthesis
VYKKFVLKVLKNHPHIVAISDFTKSEFLRIYNYDESFVHVIKSGYDSIESPNLDYSNYDHEILGNYILWITNSLKHKNNSFAINSFINSDLKKTNFKIVIVGSLSKSDYLLLMKYKVKFELLSHSTFENLAKLYKYSQFVYSPTLLEGHNLCISEALQFGAKVLCSDIPVHREYYNNMVNFFSPNDLDNSVECLNNALFFESFWSKSNYPKKLRNFADTAKQYYNLFKEIDSE